MQPRWQNVVQHVYQWCRLMGSTSLHRIYCFGQWSKWWLHKLHVTSVNFKSGTGSWPWWWRDGGGQNRDIINVLEDALKPDLQAENSQMHPHPSSHSKKNPEQTETGPEEAGSPRVCPVGSVSQAGWRERKWQTRLSALVAATMTAIQSKQEGQSGQIISPTSNMEQVLLPEPICINDSDEDESKPSNGSTS